MEKSTDDRIAVAIVQETQARFADLSSVSFDKGFHSPHNQPFQGAHSAESCHQFQCESCHRFHAKAATHSGAKLPPVGAKRRGVLHCYSAGAVVVNLA
jgi:cytochrome c2